MRCISRLLLISAVFSFSNFAKAQESNIFTWDGRSDFAAGYFDVFSENGLLIALPSLHANSLNELILQEATYNPPDFTKCAIDRNHARERREKISETIVTAEYNSKRKDADLKKGEITLGTLDDVIINDIAGWRWLTKEEALQSQRLETLLKGLCIGSYFSSARTYPNIYTWKTYVTDRDIIQLKKRGGGWSKGSDAGHSGLAVLVKKPNSLEYSPLNSFDGSIDGIKQFAQAYVELKSNINRLDIPSPRYQVAPPMPDLLKDEFETTVAFQARRKVAQQKWEEEVRKVEKENKKLSSEYENKLANAEQDHQNKVQIVSSATFKSRMYQEGYNKGIKQVLGKPYFRDIVYDADSQKMNATVFSAQDDTFSRQVKFDVPLSTARTFKADLLSRKIIPVITFDDNLNIISAKALSNTAIIDIDFQQAKESGSIETLEAFINKYPQSSKTGLARNEISKIKAEEARKQAESKRRAEEKARQDAYDYEHACERYYVGYVGEYEGSGWLATGENFVVRYTNSERKSVTIEATEGGNSLSYGENKEFSCYDLLQGEKRARN